MGPWSPTPVGDAVLLVATDGGGGHGQFPGCGSNLYRTSTALEVPATMLQKDVYDAVPSERGVVGIYHKKTKKGPATRLGIYDAEAGHFATPGWLKAAKAAAAHHLQKGPQGLISVVGYKPATVLVIDTQAKTVRSVKPPRKASNGLWAMPTPEGTWLMTFPYSLSFARADGGRSILVDPCAGTGAGDPCDWRPVGWTDGAVWFVAGPKDENDQWDFERTVLRRYRFGETESSLDVPFAGVLPRDPAEALAEVTIWGGTAHTQVAASRDCADLQAWSEAADDVRETYLNNSGPDDPNYQYAREVMVQADDQMEAIGCHD